MQHQLPPAVVSAHFFESLPLIFEVEESTGSWTGLCSLECGFCFQGLDSDSSIPPVSTAMETSKYRLESFSGEELGFGESQC